MRVGFHSFLFALGTTLFFLKGLAEDSIFIIVAKPYGKNIKLVSLFLLEW